MSKRRSDVIDLTGRVFGRLTVLRIDVRRRPTRWICRCACGAERSVIGAHLRSGETQSCGCYRNECCAGISRVHGMHRTATYYTWRSMLNRCSNPRSQDWTWYGGRGITVCERWLTFENFLADMGERPSGMSIDRCDNDGNYEPGNCRWSTAVEQHNNTRSNHRLTWNGETMTISQWSHRLGMPVHAMFQRIKRGWSVERTLSTPVARKQRRAA